MKIAIVGAGAMGSLFGALLTEAGLDVWLLDIWEPHISTMKQKGLSVQREAQTRVVKVNATTDPSQIGMVDLVIVFVKSYHTASAAKTARELAGRRGVVLTLQNGMGNTDIIAQAIEPRRIIAGTTSHGATLIGPGTILHAGIGPTTIGMWADSDQTQANKIAAIFNKAGIKTEVVEDVRSVLWTKLLINVGINAITALTGIKNGQILDLDATKELCRRAVEEGMAVAKAQGIKVKDDMVEQVFRVAGATASNRSSMGQDVDRKRQTEIQAINGFVVREGGKLGIKTPVNQTLTALIETLQAHY